MMKVYKKVENNNDLIIIAIINAPKIVFILSIITIKIFFFHIEITTVATANGLSSDKVKKILNFFFIIF